MAALQSCQCTCCDPSVFTGTIALLLCVELQALAFLGVMQSSTGHIQPDTVTYNTVLKACCNAGQLNRAMQVLNPICAK